MIVFLLIVIIAILLFGGAAILGIAGLILGGIATVAVITYVGVHYEIDHDQAFWGFIGLCAVVSAVSGYHAVKENAKKRKQRVAYADKWDDMLRRDMRGDMTTREYLEKYPEFRDYYNAWIALGRKRPEDQ
jgi:hypothetical protein